MTGTGRSSHGAGCGDPQHVSVDDRQSVIYEPLAGCNSIPVYALSRRASAVTSQP